MGTEATRADDGARGRSIQESYYRRRQYRAAGCFSVRPSFDERGERSRFVSFKL